MSKTMTKKEISEVLRLHKMWLSGKKGGRKADLRGYNLRRTNLRLADLRRANLKGVNFEEANLRLSDLRGANLKDADLECADLRWADIRGANLREANLNGVDFEGADLRGADLDFSCLPLWCGGQFKTDEKICKQLVAHTLRIMELSNEGSDELRELMSEYKKGWHREEEF